jgi:Xaa-Pro dipeptidase
MTRTLFAHRGVCADARAAARGTLLTVAACGAALAVSACGAAPQPASAPAAERPAWLDAPNPWPEIRQERLRSLLPDAMRRAGVDAWIVLLRENANDPLAIHLGGENAGGLAAFLYFAGESDFTAIAISPWGEATALREMAVHDSVIVPPTGASVWDEVARLVTVRDPARIAVNSGARAVADGLSHTLRLQLEQALGARHAARLESADELVYQWLSIKTPREVEILRNAARLTEQLEIEAYATVVPGETRDSDVARFLKRRMAELGVTDAWAPDQNPNVNSGADRGHSHATDRVIQPGDFIQTDFGIRVFGMWVTDIQRFAYVLAPGERAPPAEALERWENARRGGELAFLAMRPGVTGRDVDRAQREWMKARGSLPVPWSTGHPVGYWAHDVGPALAGGLDDSPQRPAADRVLQAGQVFAFDGFFSWPLPDAGAGATKTISVEEMAVITPDGAEFLVPPQRELILIGSGG